MVDQSTEKTFKWLNVTQFFGALNDNLYKLAMVFFLISTHPETSPDRIMANTGVIFVIPFLLFSDAAGVLADKISKRTMIVRLKIVEVVLMSTGCLFFYVGSTLGLYLVLFLMSTQSAFFGPSKYGIVPELVPTERLSKANSFIVSATFLSIIIGTILASLLAGGKTGFVLCGIICIAMSLVGFSASKKIYKTPAGSGTRSISPVFFLGIWKTMTSVSKDKYLLMAIITSSYFWMVAAYAQMNLVPYGIELMHLTPEKSNFSGYLFLIVAVGIGMGSLLAGVLSGRNIEFGIVPIGAFGLSISLVSLNMAGHHMIWAMGCILFLGIFAGLFILPLDALIQWKTSENNRGAVLAASNFLNFVGILGASLMIKLFQQQLGFTPGQAFMLLGVMTFVLGVATMIVLPDFFIRFVMLVITKATCRMDVKGIEHVPVEGGCLIVSNITSWRDPFLVMATGQRRIRFLIERDIYNISWLNWFFRIMQSIPVSNQDHPATIFKTVRQARKAVMDGFLLCVFAQGKIKKTEPVASFQKGFEYIIKHTGHQIIPVHISRTGKHMLDNDQGGIWSKITSTIFYPATINFGEPMPDTTRAFEVRDRIQQLGERD
jgi:acyl-[acyl-carrier-protein]-phospholipid O-acyltransferase/long-chain-fatty-acid--[acyl-carrier-protein] ligase